MLLRRNITHKSLVHSIYSVSYMFRTLWKSNNKRIWDDVQYILLTLQCGVTSTARRGENITCRGVTSTACHAALSHSFDYISTTQW